MINKVAMLVAAADSGDDIREQFEAGGRPLRWVALPKLQVFKSRRQTSPKPRADISPFTAAGLMMSSKARDALGDFLARFGQLLEVDVDGQVEYYFNPTHPINSIDAERSEKRVSGAINKPSFIDSLIPTEALVFIDPSMPVDIYLNHAAKLELEVRVASNRISGMTFQPLEI